ncbi:hypothetical protein MPH_01254 [Macrophomina phaseolina MS6]|uniref:Uncharacterized protein n=1 Tax=Macrophomina phaseolina (strain MS6) TaxID=1126212 RepID=K2SXV1_MACPH|nr:hypothetical protein MPH_01254 [Macrophomina phaseolina MS6]
MPEAPMWRRDGDTGCGNDGSEEREEPDRSESNTSSDSSENEEIDLLDFLAQTARAPRRPLSFGEGTTGVTWRSGNSGTISVGVERESGGGRGRGTSASAMAVAASVGEEGTRAAATDDEETPWGRENVPIKLRRLGYLEEKRKKRIARSWPPLSLAERRREFVKLNPLAATMHRDRVVGVGGTEILLRSGSMRKTERNLEFLRSARACASEPDLRQLGEPEVHVLADLLRLKKGPCRPSALGLKVLQWALENAGAAGTREFKPTWTGGGLDDLPAVKDGGEPLGIEETTYEESRLLAVKSQRYGKWLRGVREGMWEDEDEDDEWEKRTLCSLESMPDPVLNVMRWAGTGSNRAGWNTIWDPRSLTGQKVEAWKALQAKLAQEREDREAALRGEIVTVGGPRYEEIEASDAPMMGRSLGEWWSKSGMGSFIRTPSTESVAAEH